LPHFFRNTTGGLKQGVGVHKSTQLKDIIMSDVDVKQNLTIELNREVSDRMRYTRWFKYDRD